MTYDPRGFEKAMKRAVCPHYGNKPVCDICADKQNEGWEFHGSITYADGTVGDRYRRPFGLSFEFSEVKRVNGKWQCASGVCGQPGCNREECQPKHKAQ